MSISLDLKLIFSCLSMFGFIKIVGFLCLVTCIISEDEITFSTEDELYEFYKNWTAAESMETFRNIQARFIKANMNISVDPCYDFYEYACGNFKNFIPENNNWTVPAMPFLVAMMQKRLVTEVIASEIDSDESEAEVKAKGLYQSCMDNSTWDYQVLGNFVKSFASWPLLDEAWSEDNFDWLNLTAYASLYDVNYFFSQSVIEKNKTYFNYFSVSRNFPTTANVSNFDSYVENIKENFKLLSIDIEWKQDMLNELHDFDTKFSHLKHEFIFTPSTNYRLDELKEKIPGINFRKYLQILRGKRGIPFSEVIIIDQQIYFDDILELMAETNMSAIANYMLVHMALEMAQTSMSKIAPNLESVCEMFVRKQMQSAVVALYAKHYFNEDSYTHIVNIVDELQEASRQVINNSDWIDDQTKIKALEKLNVITKRIASEDGIPERTKLNQEYADLNIDPKNFIQNLINLRRHAVRRNQLKVGQNSTDFFVDPLTLGAYFAPFQKGTFILPVAILQPPFFHKYSARFANYGSVGSISGHELMHAFDVQGFRYGPDGDKSKWWDLRLNLIYYTRTACYYLQYDKYNIESINKTIDGELTIDENIADNEGLKIALMAYKDWMKNNENLVETTNLESIGLNLTNIQAFFVSYAQSYCSEISNSKLQIVIEQDVHSPSMARVLVPLSNSPDFSEAYNCPVGSRMNPENKCNYLRK